MRRETEWFRRFLEQMPNLETQSCLHYCCCFPSSTAVLWPKARRWRQKLLESRSMMQKMNPYLVLATNHHLVQQTIQNFDRLVQNFDRLVQNFDRLVQNFDRLVQMNRHFQAQVKLHCRPDFHVYSNAGYR